MVIVDNQWNSIAILLSQNRPFFEALGDRHRQEMLILLASKRRNVGELAIDVGLSRPATSHHLKILKNAGLVIVEREGVKNFYSPTFSSSTPPLEALLQEVMRLS